MQKELISLHSRVVLPAPSADLVAPEDMAFAMNREVAVFGFTLDRAIIDRLKVLDRATLLSFRQNLLANLAEVTGADKKHTVLFNKFPYETPDKAEFLMSRIVGFFSNELKLYEHTNYRVLDCGHAIDPKLFDLSDFNGCPICGAQSHDLQQVETVLHDFQTITPLRLLKLADDGFLGDLGNALIGRNSSLSMSERSLLRDIHERGVEISMPSKIFKETLPFAYSVFGAEAIRSSISGATDVLRLAYFVSDSESDLSLKENVRFKVSTRHKKAFLSLLEDREDLAEDLLRHRERWLRLGERLNPGSKENRRRFPKTAAAFDTLRNDPKSIQTLSRLVERKVRNLTIDAELLSALSKRPGEFVRRIDFMLRTSTDTTEVLAAFEKAVPLATTKMLFEVEKYLSHRGMASRKRVFVPKGQMNKVKIIADTRQRIPEATLLRAMNIVNAELLGRLEKREPMGRVYVDPMLKRMLVPFNRRGDSAASAAVQKGSRYPINPKAKVIRLFQWWTGRDLDLSAVLFGDNFKFIDQVSYTNLSGYGMTHSGDITYAPNGAAEFIDIEIDTIRERGVRYVAMSVISFSGESFNTFPAFAGFMERDALKSGARFEPESVALKYEVNAQATQSMPLIFDVLTREVIFADISGSKRRFARVHGNDDEIGTLAQAVIEMPLRKPTLHDVISMNALARGSLAATAEEADMVFGLDLDTDKVIAEMMA